MDESNDLDGLTIAPGVIETIIMLAVLEVEGVAAVGSKPPASGVLPTLGKKQATPGITICEEGDRVVVDVCVQVCYGYRLTDIARSVRTAVVNALESQANIEASVVNVTIDAISFPC